jgi:GNAT superfamily N-acetyltransferase
MITISREQPDTPTAQALISELENTLSPLYPDESRHGYSIERLLRDNVPFFVARYEGQAAGCGGIEIVGSDYAELKRMYVRPQFRGLGVAKALLVYLNDFARENGVTTLRLETGIHQIEAIGLYEKFGFRRIEHFGPYKEDPLSLFFEKAVSTL